MPNRPPTATPSRTDDCAGKGRVKSKPRGVGHGGRSAPTSAARSSAFRHQCSSPPPVLTPRPPSDPSPVSRRHAVWLNIGRGGVWQPHGRGHIIVPKVQPRAAGFGPKKTLTTMIRPGVDLRTRARSATAITRGRRHLVQARGGRAWHPPARTGAGKTTTLEMIEPAPPVAGEGGGARPASVAHPRSVQDGSSSCSRPPVQDAHRRAADAVRALLRPPDWLGAPPVRSAQPRGEGGVLRRPCRAPATAAGVALALFTTGRRVPGRAHHRPRPAGARTCGT